MSIVLSAGAIYAFTKRALHPIYSLSVATFVFIGWVGTLFLVIWTNEWDIAGGDSAYEEAQAMGEGYWIAPPGLLVVKDLFYGVVTTT